MRGFRWAGAVPLMLLVSCISPVGDDGGSMMVLDAGTTDAGTHSDAGVVDAGADAGLDASIPAGTPIGVDGGSITVGSTTLTFPPGAVRTTIYVEVEPFTGGPPTGYETLSPGLLLSPEGQQFDRAVALTFDTTGVAPVRELKLATAPRGSTQFQVLRAVRSANTATAFLWHFSTAQLVGPLDAGVAPDAGTDAGMPVAICGPVPADISMLDAGPGCGCRPLGAPCYDSSDCSTGVCFYTADPPMGHGRICANQCMSPGECCPTWGCVEVVFGASFCLPPP